MSGAGPKRPSYAALRAALEACHSELQRYVNSYMEGESWEDHPEMRPVQRVCDRARTLLARAALAQSRGEGK